MQRDLPFVIVFICLLSSCKKDDEHVVLFNNHPSSERMLLVLSAPSVSEPYYSSAFEEIVDFQVNYATAIMGHDDVVVIVDAETEPYYSGRLPDDILITADVYDIWMRDFTTVNPLNPVQFRYTAASMTEQESQEVQQSFNSFADVYSIVRSHSNYLLDGGNLVDNYNGRVVTTTRFLDDNNLSYTEGKQLLQSLLGASEVAIIQPDDAVLAHADGMVMWSDENTLLVNDYSDYPLFRDAVLSELQLSFPSANIIEVPVTFSENLPGEWVGFESACGIHLNSTVTFQNIYLPVFNQPQDQSIVDLIRQHTGKNVITVNAEGVCPMGGSVRCLTWQLAGENANRLILAARSN